MNMKEYVKKIKPGDIITLDDTVAIKGVYRRKSFVVSSIDEHGYITFKNKSGKDVNIYIIYVVAINGEPFHVPNTHGHYLAYNGLLIVFDSSETGQDPYVVKPKDNGMITYSKLHSSGSINTLIYRAYIMAHDDDKWELDNILKAITSLCVWSNDTTIDDLRKKLLKEDYAISYLLDHWIDNITRKHPDKINYV